jgi:hypothetical protein
MNYGMMSDEMIEATRLTRAGQLVEAMTLIQRTLAGASASSGTMTPPVSTAPNEATAVVAAPPEATESTSSGTITPTVSTEPSEVTAVVVAPPEATESTVRGRLRSLLVSVGKCIWD